MHKKFRIRFSFSCSDNRQSKTRTEGTKGSDPFKDSAEKPYECFDEAQHERKISNDFKCSSARPEALEA